MAFFGTQQNNEKDNTPNVNTRSYQFMNKDGFDPSALTIGAWNEMMSLRINPALDKSRQTDGRVFDYDKSVSTSLTAEKVILLLYKINKEIIPAIESDTDKSVGIPLNGGESLLIIGTGKKFTKESCIYLGIHKSLNENTKKPEMSMFYEFKTAMTIDDYDEKTGKYSMISDIQAEFKLFIELLKAFIVGTSNFTVHADRVVNKFNNDRLQNNIYAIGQKVGANIGNGKSYSQRSNIFNSSHSDSNKSDDRMADMSELGSIDDLNSFMNE